MVVDVDELEVDDVLDVDVLELDVLELEVVEFDVVEVELVDVELVDVDDDVDVLSCRSNAAVFVDDGTVEGVADWTRVVEVLEVGARDVVVDEVGSSAGVTVMPFRSPRR
jgi:hypothetical protein